MKFHLNHDPANKTLTIPAPLCSSPALPRPAI